MLEAVYDLASTQGTSQLAEGTHLSDAAALSCVELSIAVQPTEEKGLDCQQSPTDMGLSCPICLDVLVRPVVLSCQHTACRGCWIRFLQSPEVRAFAHRTGKVACPLGRCELLPIVPEVNAALQKEAKAKFASRLAMRSCKISEAEEARKADEVNDWAHAGCAPDEVERAACTEAAARSRLQQRMQRLLLFVLFVMAVVEIVVLMLLICDPVRARAWAWRALLSIASSAGAACFLYAFVAGDVTRARRDSFGTTTPATLEHGAAVVQVPGVPILHVAEHGEARPATELSQEPSERV